MTENHGPTLEYATAPPPTPKPAPTLVRRLVYGFLGWIAANVGVVSTVMAIYWGHLARTTPNATASRLSLVVVGIGTVVAALAFFAAFKLFRAALREIGSLIPVLRRMKNPPR